MNQHTTVGIMSLHELLELEHYLMEKVGAAEAETKIGPLRAAIVSDLRETALSTARRFASFFARQLYHKEGDTAHFIRENLYETLFDLAKSVDAFEDSDAFNESHLRRVGKYAACLAENHIRDHQAEYLEYHPETYARDLEKAAPLHDLGKICVLDRLVNDSRKYTTTERRIMEVHVECADIMLLIPGYERGKKTGIPLARHAARDHHNRPDGRGYGGIPGKPSLAGCILAVVDNLDAGTSKRPYKEALPFDQVVQEWILPHQGTQFDAAVVDTFVRYLDSFKQIYTELH